jgi:hypothetical protein
MAGVLRMSKFIYVVDTGYLDEFYKVDGYYDELAHKEIWLKINSAIKNKDRIYIPVPVIFELANHIAHIKNTNNRDKLANQFVNDIKNSLVKDSPFVLVPCQDFQSIENLIINLTQFAEKYSKQGIGLTDTAVYLQAKLLYTKYKSLKNYSVYILTKDKSLASRKLDV